MADLRQQQPQDGDGDGSSYDRDAFDHWLSAREHGWNPDKLGLPDGGAGCDTRAAVLFRDGIRVRANSDCTVTAGRWVDPYTGDTITDPGRLDADHLVPLQHAYRAGAADWSDKKRAAFANDRREVVAVSATANREKGSDGPADWRPDRRSGWCSYGWRWWQVKHEWKLSYLSHAEVDATKRMLHSC